MKVIGYTARTRSMRADQPDEISTSAPQIPPPTSLPEVLGHPPGGSTKRGSSTYFLGNMHNVDSSESHRTSLAGYDSITWRLVNMMRVPLPR